MALNSRLASSKGAVRYRRTFLTSTPSLPSFFPQISLRAIGWQFFVQFMSVGLDSVHVHSVSSVHAQTKYMYTYV